MGINIMPKQKRKPQRGGKAALNAMHRTLGVPQDYTIAHPMYGTGFWDTIKSGFNWVKDNKIISTVASLIPHPAAQRVGAVAGQLGFGRGRKRKVLKV